MDFMTRMTSEELAFLRTIAADPENDDLRLVYADWLEEHDQLGRAEIIRLQIKGENANELIQSNERCFWEEQFVCRVEGIHPFTVPTEQNWRRGFLFGLTWEMRDPRVIYWIKAVADLFPITHLRINAPRIIFPFALSRIQPYRNPRLRLVISHYDLNPLVQRQLTILFPDSTLESEHPIRVDAPRPTGVGLPTRVLSGSGTLLWEPSGFVSRSSDLFISPEAVEELRQWGQAALPNPEEDDE